MNDQEKKSIADLLIVGPRGVKRVAFAAYDAFLDDPVKTAEDLREMVPVDKLPDVIFGLFAHLTIGSNPESEEKLEQLKYMFPGELATYRKRARLNPKPWMPE